MPSKNPAQRLRDIIDNIDAIRAFTTGMSLGGFTGDRKTVYAVTRALEIISEASRRLPEDLKLRHPEIDWPGVAAAGNVYRHEYEVVDDALVWHTVQHSLTSLRDVSTLSCRDWLAGPISGRVLWPATWIPKNGEKVGKQDFWGANIILRRLQTVTFVCENPTGRDVSEGHAPVDD